MGHLCLNFRGFFRVLTRPMKTEPTSVFYIPLYYVEEGIEVWKIHNHTSLVEHSSTSQRI